MLDHYTPWPLSEKRPVLDWFPCSSMISQSFKTFLHKFSDGEFEPLSIDALSSPPELPDVMKPQDPGASNSEGS